MENLKQIGTRVQGIRTEANFSVEQMASALGIAPEEYVAYENGSAEAPFSLFYKLAEFFLKTRSTNGEKQVFKGFPATCLFIVL